MNALRELRRLLSRSEFPFVEIALKRGVIPLLGQCLKFGSEDEQVMISLCISDKHVFHYACLQVK